jgi:hypothetical protein
MSSHSLFFVQVGSGLCVLCVMHQKKSICLLSKRNMLLVLLFSFCHGIVSSMLVFIATYIQMW